VPRKGSKRRRAELPPSHPQRPGPPPTRPPLGQDGPPGVPPPPDAPFARRLREHLGADPATLAVLNEQFDPSEHPNLQLALDAYLAAPGREHELLGMLGEQKRFQGMSLSDLLKPSRSGWGPPPPEVGPVDYVNFKLADGNVLACVQSAVVLITDDGQPLVVTVSGVVEHSPRQRVSIEVLAPERAQAERFLAELRRLVRTHSVYRGQALYLSFNQYGSFGVNFHAVPEIRREQIILPERVLSLVERHTIGFARHSDQLLAAGRHLKRGLLLHGPPGTGKTLTAMYIASQMRDRTVIILTGRGFGLIQRSVEQARLLQPSIVLFEDVDLVAEERTREHSSGPLLFELLNEMDGIGNDADVIFLLTTNRPDLLEPALAARPGRIDQAVEIPLPDAEARRRLFDLYARGMQVNVTDWTPFVARTEGVSAAFIRELLRKAAVIAADDTGQVAVEERHLTEATHELVVEGGELTKRLLGGARPQ
jgi:hypothetical protein